VKVYFYSKRYLPNKREDGNLGAKVSTATFQGKFFGGAGSVLFVKTRAWGITLQGTELRTSGGGLGSPNRTKSLTSQAGDLSGTGGWFTCQDRFAIIWAQTNPPSGHKSKEIWGRGKIEETRLAEGHEGLVKSVLCNQNSEDPDGSAKRIRGREGDRLWEKEYLSPP